MVYQHYQQVINEKITLLNQTLADLKESGANETKSTAGDKHETALAMLQIEQANTRTQLKEALEQKLIFERINPMLIHEKVSNGSLIKTNRGYLFMSIAMGKATIEGVTVTALSPQSPLGAKLLGLKVNSAATVNGNQFLIESIQ